MVPTKREPDATEPMVEPTRTTTNEQANRPERKRIFHDFAKWTAVICLAIRFTAKSAQRSTLIDLTLN